MNGGLLEFDDDFGKDAPRYTPDKEQEIQAETVITTQQSDQMSNKTNNKDHDEAKHFIKNGNIAELLNLVSTPLAEFDKKVIWLNIKGANNFITQSSINTVSARSGIGKTFFATALALELLEQGRIKQVIHFNFDGNTSIFRSRGQNDKIKHYGNVKKWIHIRPQEIFNLGFKGIDEIIDCYLNSNNDFSGVFFIFDSLVNFCPRMNETEAVAKFYTRLRALADLGAILWINTHNKKGEDIFTGSQMIESLSDVMYNLTADKKETEIVFAFEVKKARDLHKNQAFSLDLKTNFIFAMKYDEVKEPSVRNKLIAEFKTILAENPNGITQGELIELSGRKSDDKTAKDIIKEFDGELWQSQKIGTQKLIKAYKI